MISINNGTGITAINNTLDKTLQNKESNGKFSDVLKNALDEANKLKKESDQLSDDFVLGKNDNLHEVMIASQKAELSVMFVTEVRNRLMDTYQEFMRMQI
jgi:flagellar hook-basal body complex protein FliE